jgi:hypothetical protein
MVKAFPTVTGAVGMDLRDYFAAKALQGFAADPEIDANAEEVARMAYKWADAMMKAREGK